MRGIYSILPPNLGKQKAKTIIGSAQELLIECCPTPSTVARTMPRCATHLQRCNALLLSSQYLKETSSTAQILRLYFQAQGYEQYDLNRGLRP